VKAEELTALDAEELDGRLKGARRELYELRFKLAVGQLDDHRQVRKIRKDIARILTVVHLRRLGAEPVPALVAERATAAEDLVEQADPIVVAALPEDEQGASESATPENVETAAEAEPEQVPPPKSRRRRAAPSEEAE
jgi:large subunit ribosomal protein L29